MRTMSQHARRGFTLVELLVVIGIIAILVTILVPSLIHARTMARVLSCQKNLKDCAAAIGQYMHANEGNPWLFANGTCDLPNESKAAIGGGGPGNPALALVEDRDGKSLGRLEAPVLFCPLSKKLKAADHYKAVCEGVSDKFWGTYAWYWQKRVGSKDPEAAAGVRKFHENSIKNVNDASGSLLMMDTDMALGQVKFNNDTTWASDAYSFEHYNALMLDGSTSQVGTTADEAKAYKWGRNSSGQSNPPTTSGYEE